MCFSPKVSVPKATISNTPIEAAPLADKVEGVKFGSESSDDDTGTESLTVKKDNAGDAELSKNNTTSSSDINNTASTVAKSIKRKPVFGGNK